jgi:hypothetical protein
MKSTVKTRRDMCYVIGKRAALLKPAQAALAWASLSEQIEAMGSLDIPKFINVLSAIRTATIKGRQIR